jgi:hypothetical protein
LVIGCGYSELLLRSINRRFCHVDLRLGILISGTGIIEFLFGDEPRAFFAASARRV